MWNRLQILRVAFPWLVLTKYHCNTLTATHCNTRKCISGCRYYAWHSRDSYWSLRLFVSWCDWQTGVSWLPHMCVMTDWYVCRDSFLCLIWLIYMCDVTRIDTLVIPALMRLARWCVMTPSYVCHDSLICVSWVRDMRVMIRLHVYCVMTHSNLYHGLFICVSCCSVLRCCTSTNLLARGKKKVFAVLFLMRVPQQSHLLKSNPTGIYRLCSKAYSKMMFVGASSANRRAVVDGKRSKIAKSVWALVLYLPPKNAEIAFETPRTPLFTYSCIKLPCFYWKTTWNLAEEEVMAF